MIAVLRIHGQINLKEEIVNTFDRLRLMRKLHCIFIDEKDVIRMGMLKKINDFVSWGKIDDKLMEEIIEKRGEKNAKGEYRGFCRMHPPIGGFKKSTKTSAGAGKGILGMNKDLDKLLGRMI